MRLIGVLGLDFSKYNMIDRLLMVFGEKEIIEVGTYPVYLLLQEEESGKINQVKIRIKVIEAQTEQKEKGDTHKDSDEGGEDFKEKDKEYDVEIDELPLKIKELAEKISPEDLKVILESQSVPNHRKQSYFNQVIEIKHDALVEDF